MDPISLIATLGAPITAATGSATAGALAGAGAAGYGANKLGQGVKKALTPDMPENPKTSIAPIPDDKSREQAMQRSAARRYAGQGRQGTVLSGGSSTLG